jgi:hypothetical protein
VASAGELIREAQHAFMNISPGSSDERKYTARAKKYANRVIRKYPASSEATQARQILARLGVIQMPARVRVSPHKSHTPEPSHQHDLRTPKIAAARVRTTKSVAKDDSWQQIWRSFLDLSYSKKKVLAFVTMFAFFIISFMPFLFVFFAFYAFQPAVLRRHLHQVLVALA